jgi:hypothetical protein
VAFLDLWSEQSRREVSNLVAVVVNEAVGLIAGATLAGACDAALELELLLLLLSHHGRTDARLIGVLSGEPSRWLRTAGGALALGSHRFLGRTSESDHLLRPLRLRQRAARNGLVVLEGGLSHQRASQ